MSQSEQSRNYAVVADAIGYIRSRARQQPALADVAAHVGLSEYHLQRVFSEWAGISPKRFLQYLTKERAKEALRASADVLAASLDAGLSSPGRLHDLMISCEAMTPGEIRQSGKGATVVHGVADTPFGEALLGWTPRGICNLVFCDDDREQQLQAFSREWPAATQLRDDGAAAALAERIFRSATEPARLHLLLRGTNFQIKVWEALLRIGSSRLVSYRMLAGMIGSPKSHRTVGTAIAANRIGFLIPCHRVIRESAAAGHYHWGSDRKIAIQAWEAARSDDQD